MGASEVCHRLCTVEAGALSEIQVTRSSCRASGSPEQLSDPQPDNGEEAHASSLMKQLARMVTFLAEAPFLRLAQIIVESWLTLYTPKF